MTVSSFLCQRWPPPRRSWQIAQAQVFVLGYDIRGLGLDEASVRQFGDKGLIDDVDADHQGLALFEIHGLAGLGQVLDQVGIGLLLIGQTALELSAQSGNLGGIERHVLIFGHLDRDALEVRQEAGAAELAAAAADSPQHAGFLAGTDLPELNAHPEPFHQVFQKLPEIHAAFGDKIEDHLVAVERLLHGDQLHGQGTGIDALPAKAEALAFLALHVDQAFHVGLGHGAHNGLDLRQPCGILFRRASQYLGHGLALLGLHDHHVPALDLQFTGIEDIRSQHMRKAHIDQMAFLG